MSIRREELPGNDLAEVNWIIEALETQLEADSIDKDADLQIAAPNNFAMMKDNSENDHTSHRADLLSDGLAN